MGHMFKKSNNMGKEDNVNIKIKYLSLLKIKTTKKNSFTFYPDKKSKAIQFFSYLKNQFRHIS